MPSSTFSVLQSASSLSTWPIDYLAIGICVAVVALDAFRSGTGRAASFVIAFPITSVLFTWIQKTILLSSIAGNFSGTIPQAIIFGILFAIIFVLINRIVGSFGFGEASMVNALLTALAAAITLICFWVSTPALSAIWQFNSFFVALFSESYRLLWTLGTLIILAFVRS